MYGLIYILLVWLQKLINNILLRCFSVKSAFYFQILFDDHAVKFLINLILVLIASDH